MTEPSKADVFVDVLFEDGLLYLVLSNNGEQAAENVRVEFDKPLLGIDSVDMSQLGVFKHLEYLAPGKNIAVLLDRAPAFYARRQRSRIKLKVVWRVGRTSFGSTMNHDMRAYADIPYIVHQPNKSRRGHSRRWGSR